MSNTLAEVIEDVLTGVLFGDEPDAFREDFDRLPSSDQFLALDDEPASIAQTRLHSLTGGMREYLTFSSPAEFASRNIFTEERPLRRARSVFSVQDTTSR